MKHMVCSLETWSSQHWSLSTGELEGDTGKSRFACPKREIATDNGRSNGSVDYLACWLAANCKCCSDPINSLYFQCHFLTPLSLHALQLYLHFYNAVFVGAGVTLLQLPFLTLEIGTNLIGKEGIWIFHWSAPQRVFSKMGIYHPVLISQPPV